MGAQDRKRRDDRGLPIDYARWYFRNEATLLIRVLQYWWGE
jgi:hypothetical protein